MKPTARSSLALFGRVCRPHSKIYSGVVQLNNLGEAVVSLPPWFNAKRHRQRNDHFSYQVRPLLTAVVLAQSA